MVTASPPTPDAQTVAATMAAAPLMLADGSSVRLAVRGMDAAGEWARILASDATGRVVGHAAFARVYGPRAELTLVVDDAYWDRGLADALLTTLRARAAEHGIATLLVRVRAFDVRLLALLRRAGAVGETASGGGVDVELPTGSCAG
jgi:GNAT superfamily N-acetyltransferase